MQLHKATFLELQNDKCSEYKHLDVSRHQMWKKNYLIIVHDANKGYLQHGRLLNLSTLEKKKNY